MITVEQLAAIRKDNAGWSDGYKNADRSGIIAQRHDLLEYIDALLRQQSRLREALDGCSIWLNASLNCASHPWDQDQREAAAECAATAATLLSEVPQK